MPEDWTAIANEVAEALASVEDVGALKNEALIIRRVKVGGSDHNPTLEPVNYPVRFIFTKWKNSELNGTSILSTDTKILCSVTDIVPQAEDRFKFNGKTLQIIDAWPLRPAGIDLLYTIQARD